MTSALFTLGARYVILVLVVAALAWAAAREAPARRGPPVERNPGWALLLIIVGIVVVLIAIGEML
jgi:heme/copper-type cytochrome/quinol oxidase subunit 2